MSVLMRSLIIVVLLDIPAQATTYNAADCTPAAIAAAIGLTTAGDTVQLPACTEVWTDVWVESTNDKITIRGAGIDVTNISTNGRAFIMRTTTTGFAQWRLTNMTITTTAGSNPLIEIITAAMSTIETGWRIDHIRFVKTTGGGDHILIGGPTYGLIDHNTFDWSLFGTIILGSAYRDAEYQNFPTAGPYGTLIHSQPLDWGTANAIFVETNTFNCNGSGGGAAWDTSAGANRVVFRYNTVNGCYFYAHWTRDGPGDPTGEYGGILAEVYNNKFLANAGGYTGHFARLEAGTAAIYNNYVTFLVSGTPTPKVQLDERRCEAFPDCGFPGPFGCCDGTRTWDGNSGDTAAPGYPCRGQVGRGTGKTWAQILAGNQEASEPIYVWNNGTQETCATGGACTDTSTVVPSACPNYITSTPHPNGDIDYVVGTAKPSYTPYTYPHPLATDGGVVPVLSRFLQ